MTVPVPSRMRNLPVDKHGRLVPWFVHWVDGKPDFRVIRPGGFNEAVLNQKCWLCGKIMGRYTSFVIGPMCAVNRLSSEPGSHLDCAVYAAKVCPFLTNPNMNRRENGLDEYVKPPGEMCLRNPGATAVWTSRNWYLMAKSPNKYLVNLGDPTGVQWFAEGRDATRAEVLAAIDSGMPILEEACRREDNPELFLASLMEQYHEVLPLLPA